MSAPNSYSVQSCYARPAIEHCKVQFIPSIMMVVIVCNVAKVASICLSFWRKGWSRSLVTIGGLCTLLVVSHQAIMLIFGPRRRHCEFAGAARFHYYKCLSGGL